MLYTNVNNFSSTSSEPKYPIFKIQYYDTPYCVPSKGFGVKYYDDPLCSSSSFFDDQYLVVDGKDNILAYDWGVGVPPGVNTNGYFKAKYFGYFKACYTGDYTFYLSKEPTDYLAFYIATGTDKTSITDPSSSGQYLSNSKKINEWDSSYKGFETSGVKISLTANNWYPFMVEYAQREKDSYVACRYLEPDGIAYNGYYSDNDSEGAYHRTAVSHKKIICASDLIYEKAWSSSASATHMSPVEISCVTSVSLNNDLNQSNTLEFRVPLLTNVTNTSGLKGFRYHTGSDLYYDDNISSYLRIGRLVKFYAGYSSNGITPQSTDYIQKFEGIITDIKISRGIKNSELLITCQDILYHAITSINENYPNKLSYVLFDHITNDENGPNGVTRPVTYDAWPLVDVVRDLFYKSGVDGSKLYARKKLNVAYNGSLAYGDYLVEDRGIYLSRRIKYGNCYTIGDDVEKDDTYIWKNSFGDKLYDSIAKLADMYGFISEVNNEGNIVFGSVNSPVVDIVDSGWIVAGFSGNWNLKDDIRADGGKYLIATGTTNNNFRIQKEVTGSWFIVNMLRKNSDRASTSLHGWSIPYNEYPTTYPQYDTTRDIRSVLDGRLGILYGRKPLIVGGIEGGLVGYTTVDSTIYVRPTASINVTDIEYSFYVDEAAYFNNDTDTLCYADIYFGQVSAANPRDLITSSLVYSNYKRPNRKTSLKDIIHLNTVVSMTAGNIYGFRFVTKHSSWPTTDEIAFPYCCYTYKNTYVSNYSTQFNCSYIARNYDINGVYAGGYEFYTDKDTSYGVFGDFTFIGSYVGGSPKTDYTKINVYRWNGASYLFITGWQVDNVYYTRFASSRDYRYPSDGSDFGGINPCKFYIHGSDIGVNTSGTLLSYGQYLVDITSSGSITSGTAITSIESYDVDFYSPKWEFSTSKNLTSLGFVQTIDDIRNDIIVVGDLIGEFRDYTTNEVINKSNPSLQYIYSRATDLSSINNPDSLNNVGRKKPFIIYEPSIIDQKHCDWMAEAILYRYNTFKKVPSWNSYGVPFLENYDNVYIIDKYAGGMISHKANGYNQWVVSISEKIDTKQYSVDIQTTPYLPWSTYTISTGPSLTSFNNLPFINIRMLDSNGKFRGYTGVDDSRRYDVYESEISGNRLAVKYDQVIDGDVIVKVMSKNIMGLPAEFPVAYLVGHLNNGEEIPEYRPWGSDYELYWDGVDKIGSARRKLGQTCNISGSSASVTINNIDFVSSYDQPGFYSPSGEYYLKFMIFPRDRSLPIKSLDTLNLDRNFNIEAATKLGISSTNATYEQLWKIMWGDPLNIYMTVSGNTGGSPRNITYVPNNTFYSNENSSQGIQFVFFSDNTTSSCNRTLYYKANMHHIFGLGCTFVLRNDASYSNWHYNDYFKYSSDNTLNWKRAYETTALGWKKYKCGYKDDILVSSADSSIYSKPISSVTVRYWPRAALIPDKVSTSRCDLLDYLRYQTTEVDDGTPYWNDGNQPQILDDFYTIIESGGRYRIVSWYGMPYTTYSVDEFVPSRTHRYSTINPISFYFDPTKNNTGAWDFLSLPDMKNDAYYSYVRHLTLASWFAGPETGWQNRVTPIISHAFQIEVAVWDGTGRLLKNNKQLVDIGITGHDHGLWDWSYVELSPYNATVTTHKHGYDQTVESQYWSRKPHSRTITMHPALAENLDDSEANTYYDLWANYGIKHPYIMPNTFVSGLDFVSDGTDNYGIGYCNISGMSMYGYWTWHGYWLEPTAYDYLKLNYNIPALYQDIASSRHWLKYPKPSDTGLLESSMILQITTNKTSINDDDFSFGGYIITTPGDYYHDVSADDELPADPYKPSYASMYSIISHTLSGWVRYNHAHLPSYEGALMSYNGLYSIKYGLDTSRISIGLISDALHPGNYTDTQISFIGNIENELRFSSYSDTVLPPIWYRSNVAFPWSDVTGGYFWWSRFLPSNGLSFPYGGWSANMVDKS